MGYSWDTFYRFSELYETGGEATLQEISRKKPIIRNRVLEYIEKAVTDLAIEFPAYGQLRTSNDLRQKGVLMSGFANTIMKDLTQENIATAKRLIKLSLKANILQLRKLLVRIVKKWW